MTTVVVSQGPGNSENGGESPSLVGYLRRYQILISSLIVLLAACVIVGGPFTAILVILFLSCGSILLMSYYLFLNTDVLELVLDNAEKIALHNRTSNIVRAFAIKALRDEEVMDVMTECTISMSERVIETVKERQIAAKFAEETMTELLLKFADDPEMKLRRMHSDEFDGAPGENPRETLPALISAVTADLIQTVGGAREVKESAIQAMEEVMRDPRMERCLLDTAMKIATDEDLQTALSTSAFAVGRHAVGTAVKSVGSSVKRKVVGMERSRRAGPTLIQYTPREPITEVS